MAWWRFITTDGREGYLRFDEQWVQIGMYWLDGTPVDEGVSYTVTATDVEPPEWGT